MTHDDSMSYVPVPKDPEPVPKDPESTGTKEAAETLRLRIFFGASFTLLSEALRALELLVARAERASEMEAAAKKVCDAYTAEAEDHNDGEFSLWKADDLVNAIVDLRAALAAGRE